MTQSTKATIGISSRACHCGNHHFAYSFDDALDHWGKYRVTHPLIRRRLEEKGMVVDTPPPPPEPHVILLSPEDAHLFKLRRWRVFPAQNRKKTRYTVQRGAIGKALQRLVLPDAKIVQFVSNDGTDCRRENLKATTMKEVCSSRGSLCRHSLCPWNPVVDDFVH